MDRDIHSEQPNVGSLRTHRSQSDLTYSYNRAMGIAMIAHRVGHVSLGVARRSGRHAQLGHVIRPTKRCGNCVTARRLLINSAQTFHHTSRWNLSIDHVRRYIIRITPRSSAFYNAILYGKIVLAQYRTQGFSTLMRVVGIFRHKQRLCALLCSFMQCSISKIRQ